jgi:hypothetical protein
MMPVAVMVLLGASIAVPLLLLEEALLRRAVVPAPGPLPPWSSVVAVALIYAGWLAIVLLRATQDGVRFGQSYFNVAEITYGVVHLWTMLLLLKPNSHWFANQLTLVRSWRHQVLIRRMFLGSLLAGSVLAFFGATEPDGRVIAVLASALALVASACVAYSMSGPTSETGDKQ